MADSVAEVAVVEEEAAAAVDAVAEAEVAVAAEEAAAEALVTAAAIADIFHAIVRINPVAAEVEVFDQVEVEVTTTEDAAEAVPGVFNAVRAVISLAIVPTLVDAAAVEEEEIEVAVAVEIVNVFRVEKPATCRAIVPAVLTSSVTNAARLGIFLAIARTPEKLLPSLTVLINRLYE